MLKLFRYLKPYTTAIIFIFIFTILQVIMSLMLPNYTSEIINNGIIAQDVGYVWSKGLQMLLVAGVSMLATVIVNWFATTMSSGYARELRLAMFTKIENMALEDMTDLSTASLITRTTNDIQQVHMVVSMIFRMMIPAPITAIGGIILALQKQRSMSLILLISVPTLLLTVFFVGGRAVPMFKRVQKRIDRLNLVFREKLTGVRIIRAYNKDASESEKIATANTDLMEQTLKVNYLMALIMPLIMLIMNVTIIAIVWYGAKFIDAGDMFPGDIIAFMQYAMQIMSAFLMLAVIYIMIPRASASADRINEVLDKETKIVDPVQPTNFGVTGGLVFDNVSFAYPGAEEPVLKGLDFTVQKGETLAIIGGTGSGKSTFLNLIPRLYEVTEGAILFNEVDIRDVSQRNLRERIGYVPQKNVLFSGTIADNLRYGKEDATEAEMWEALDIAHATEFVSQKEAGLESVVEQSGKNFSGGQKQRLAIARAIIRKPDIYLFDDSFSALDLKTDANIRAALDKVTKEAIVVIVGQRISTIKNAEKIIVLENGLIDAMGTHDELLKTSAVYREIALSQLSEEELA